MSIWVISRGEPSLGCRLAASILPCEAHMRTWSWPESAERSLEWGAATCHCGKRSGEAMSADRRGSSMSIVPIRGLFEAHLTVSDLDRSIAFYRDVLGLTLAHRIAARQVAFFWVPSSDRAMLGLWSIGTSPLRLRLHIAFDVALPAVFESIAALRRAGITPRSGDGAPVDEPVVLSWMPAASVYF
ncbi:MAG TPA: VOC family protein, partial [Acetobacteraceae bacterium]|nr:VOC family protein [Acetobacteraceae bacterium]